MIVVELSNIKGNYYFFTFLLYCAPDLQIRSYNNNLLPTLTQLVHCTVGGYARRYFYLFSCTLCGINLIWFDLIIIIITTITTAISLNIINSKMIYYCNFNYFFVDFQFYKAFAFKSLVMCLTYEILASHSNYSFPLFFSTKISMF